MDPPRTTRRAELSRRGSLRVRPAVLDDAGLLAPRLRAADLREIQASTGEGPQAAIARCLASSEPACAVTDAEGALVAVFGVVPSGADRGVIWLVGADAITDHAISFLRLARAMIPRLLEQYAVLENLVDARNEVHVRWIRWCGFTIHRTVEHGVERRPFHEFSLARREGG